MNISIVQNKHISHVLILDKGDILFQADVTHIDANRLLQRCDQIEITKDFEKELDKFSYSKPYMVYAYIGEIEKTSAKKVAAKKVAAKKAPAKKAK